MPRGVSTKKSTTIADTQAAALLSTQQKKTDSSWILVSDFDGSLFTPDLRIAYEVLHQNRRIMHMLRRKYIPLILNTARSDWTEKSKYDATLLGIRPDTLLVGAGTIIYHKQIASGTWERDKDWEKKLAQEVITVGNTKLTWGERESITLIEERTHEWEKKNKVSLQKVKGNRFLVKYSVRGVSEETLLAYMSSLQKYFDKGVKVVCVERLIPAVLGRPVGDLLIIPAVAGKDNALSYVLSRYAQMIHKRLNVYCFGDGIIDLLSYLRIPSTDEYTLHQFLVHPTQLARKVYKSLASSVPKLQSKRGPSAIYNTLEQPLPSSKNDPLRKYFSQPAKHIIDKFFPQNLSANEITLLGLTSVIEGVDGFYKHTLLPGKAIRSYMIGHLADSADGIRARQTIPSQRGQSTDYFSDRVREFYQLYSRGKRYSQENPQRALVAFEAALSCVLPSIARRQLEIVANDVNPEKEKRVLWIPTKLVFSLLYDTLLQQPQKSFLIDRKILDFAEMKYNQKIAKTKSFSIETIPFETMSVSQKNAVELWLLYVQIVQEEHAMLMKIIPQHLLSEYQKWFKSLVGSQYMNNVDIQNLRKKFNFKDYNLYLNNFLKS